MFSFAPQVRGGVGGGRDGRIRQQEREPHHGSELAPDSVLGRERFYSSVGEARGRTRNQAALLVRGFSAAARGQKLVAARLELEKGAALHRISQALRGGQHVVHGLASLPQRRRG